MSESRRLAELETEVETLRAANAALRRELLPDQWLPPALRLTRQEAVVFLAIFHREFISRDGLFALLYGHMPSPPTWDCISVFLCRLRAKLARHGVAIETVWGQGYRMTADAKAKLRALRGDA